MASCSPESPLEPDEHVTVSISEAGLEIGDFIFENPRFSFILPGLDRPALEGPFDEQLLSKLEISICEVDGVRECTSPPRMFDAEGRPRSKAIRVDPEEEHYIFNWNTGDGTWREGSAYRLTVLLTGLPLGHIDAQIVGKSQAPSPGFLPVSKRRTLPIKFGIEIGAGLAAYATGETTTPFVGASSRGYAFVGLGNVDDNTLRGLRMYDPQGAAWDVFLRPDFLPDRVQGPSGVARFRDWQLASHEGTATIEFFDTHGNPKGIETATIPKDRLAHLLLLATASQSSSGSIPTLQLSSVVLQPSVQSDRATATECMVDLNSCTVTSFLNAIGLFASSALCVASQATGGVAFTEACVVAMIDAMIEDEGTNADADAVLYIAKQTLLLARCGSLLPDALPACIKSALASVSAIIASFEPNSIEITGGNNQIGSPGAVLPEEFIVLVKDGTGRPQPGANTYWEITQGTGRLTNPWSTLEADQLGRVRNSLQLGPEPFQQVTVTAGWFRNLRVAFAASTEAALPTPVIESAGYEVYEVDGQSFVRYHIPVVNWTEYDDELFAPSPDLPPCGLNNAAGRTWIDVYTEDGTRRYGFCAIQEATNLRFLWVGWPLGVPPEPVYIEMWDRKTDRRVRSNTVELPN